ncbi:TOBE domain protein [compost metagenome]
MQAVQFQGASTRFELRLAGGGKLLVNQANLTGAALAAGVEPGQTVTASWARDAMVPLHEEG